MKLLASTLYGCIFASLVIWHPRASAADHYYSIAAEEAVTSAQAETFVQLCLDPELRLTLEKLYRAKLSEGSSITALADFVNLKSIHQLTKAIGKVIPYQKSIRVANLRLLADKTLELRLAEPQVHITLNTKPVFGIRSVNYPQRGRTLDCTSLNNTLLSDAEEKKIKLMQIEYEKGKTPSIFSFKHREERKASLQKIKALKQDLRTSYDGVKNTVRPTTPAIVMNMIHNEAQEKAVAKSPKEAKYFLVLMGYQGKNNPASQSHTFATYIKVHPDGRQEWSTISWLPEDFDKTRKICIFQNLRQAFRQEWVGSPCKIAKGKNFSIAETLTWGLERDKILSLNGPTEISQNRYELGIARYQELNSGKLGYLADDRKSRKQGTAVNCMHAVSDLPGHFEDRGYIKNEFGYGIWGLKGTHEVLRHYIEKIPDNGVLEPMVPSQSLLFKAREIPAIDRSI